MVSALLSTSYVLVAHHPHDHCAVEIDALAHLNIIGNGDRIGRWAWTSALYGPARWHSPSRVPVGPGAKPAVVSKPSRIAVNQRVRAGAW
jgi:hypothetical protein